MKYTVKDLINRLNQLPEDMEVRIAGEFSGSFGIELVNIFEGDTYVTIESNPHDFQTDVE